MASSRPNVADIIEQLGGPTKAAEKLGISNPSVVLNWRKRGSIPAERVVAVSKLTGIPPHKLRPDIFGDAA
jgi:DNA-binding transcriptional regulator YdaS (Cro superfamily)